MYEKMTLNIIVNHEISMSARKKGVANTTRH